MDTRDQTLTKLTWLHGKSHPTHHRPASLRWNYSRTAVSIMKLVRMVDDDNGDESPYPEPRTDPRSTLPREIRAWRWLRIVKRDETFSLIFFSPRRKIWSWSWGRWRSRGPTRLGGAPYRGGCLMDRPWAPSCISFAQKFLLIPKIFSVKFQVIPRTFISAQK